MEATRYREFIKAIRLLKYRKRGYFNMSEKVKDLLVENMEKVGNGDRPVKTASEINRSGYAHGYQQFAESRLLDRGTHESQLKENKDLVERL